MPFPPNTAQLTLVRPPAVEPLTLGDARGFLRVEDDGADDALIADLIAAARLECEHRTGRSLISQDWKLTLDWLPSGLAGPIPLALPYLGFGPAGDSIQLPRPPLIEIHSIAYRRQDGTEAELSPDDFAWAPGTPGRIAPRYGGLWPFSLPRIASAEITYMSGYGDDPAAVPRNIVAAIRLLTAHYWACRTGDQPEPPAINNLLSPSSWPNYA